MDVNLKIMSIKNIQMLRLSCFLPSLLKFLAIYAPAVNNVFHQLINEVFLKTFHYQQRVT